MQAKPQRVLSIDVLRGLTIALMILVNDPGDPQSVYPTLAHAEWNGYTPADLVFPHFLFLSGVSLVYSLQSRIERAHAQRLSLRPIVLQLARRSFNLLLVKLFLALAPTFRLRRIRIFGVLFRTALLSFAAGMILLATISIPILLLIIGSLLSSYWLLLRLPFGTLNGPFLDPENNLAAALDRRIAHLLHGELHVGVLYNLTHDPEGLLSSIPALATVLFGSIAACILRNKRLSQPQRLTILTISGLVALTLGQLWKRTFPINKNLWTSPYALTAAGWSLLALAGTSALYDRTSPNPALLRIARPLQIFGANALPVYALSQLGHKVSRTIHVDHKGHRLSLRSFVYRKLFAPTLSTPLRSLAFAVSYAALCFLPNLYLWRRRIFIKI